MSNTGLINLSDLENAITPQTSLVSVMAVNNEIGVKQPIREIGENILSIIALIIYCRNE